MPTLQDAKEIIRLSSKLQAIDAKLAQLDAALATEGAVSPRVFIDMGGADFEIDEGFTAEAVPTCRTLVDAERARTVAALQALGVGSLD